MREPVDPRIEAAEDALLSYRGDCEWLALHDGRYRRAQDDATQVPIGRYGAVAVVQQEASNPTARRAEGLHGVTERTSARAMRVEAVDAAFRLLYEQGRQADVTILRLYYCEAASVETIADAVGMHRDTVWRHRLSALEVVARMLEGA